MSRYPAARFTATLLVVLGWIVVAGAVLAAVLSIADGGIGPALLMVLAGGALGVFQVASGQILHAVLDGVENSFVVAEALTQTRKDIAAAARAPAPPPFQPSPPGEGAAGSQGGPALADVRLETFEDCRAALQPHGYHVSHASDGKWEIAGPQSTTYSYTIADLVASTRGTLTRIAARQSRS